MASLDQGRESLDPNWTLGEALTGGRGDAVTIGGQKRHVVGYMKDFLFEPQQARTPLSVLSGGERGRLMLARALAKPSNLLVLDEPTNDLDLETLDVLEEMLANYAGTVILISHDRDFLDRTVNAVLVPEGEGRWVEYAGGYSDMLAQRGADLAGIKAAPKPKPTRDRRSRASFTPGEDRQAPPELPREARARNAPRADRRPASERAPAAGSAGRSRIVCPRPAGVHASERGAERHPSAARRGRGALARARDAARGDRGAVVSLRERGQPRTPAGGTPARPPVFLSKKAGSSRGVPSIGAWGGSPTRVATSPPRAATIKPGHARGRQRWRTGICGCRRRWPSRASASMPPATPWR